MTRLLIIDDDEDIRAALAAWLLRKGYAVETAGDGKEGLETLARGGFDLVVTDIIMPDKEGIETILQIRRDHPDLPVIAMSGGGRTEAADLLRPASHLGANATLTKPFRASELAALIEQLLAVGEG